MILNPNGRMINNFICGSSLSPLIQTFLVCKLANYAGCLHKIVLSIKSMSNKDLQFMNLELCCPNYVVK